VRNRPATKKLPQRWGASIEPQTEGLIIAILASRPHPEQGFRTYLGVLKLYRTIPTMQAEAVCARRRDRRTDLQKHQRAHQHL